MVEEDRPAGPLSPDTIRFYTQSENGELEIPTGQNGGKQTTQDTRLVSSSTPG